MNIQTRYIDGLQYYIVQNESNKLGTSLAIWEPVGLNWLPTGSDIPDNSDLQTINHLGFITIARYFDNSYYCTGKM